METSLLLLGYINWTGHKLLIIKVSNAIQFERLPSLRSLIDEFIVYYVEWPGECSDRDLKGDSENK